MSNSFVKFSKEYRPITSLDYNPRSDVEWISKNMLQHAFNFYNIQIQPIFSCGPPPRLYLSALWCSANPLRGNLIMFCKHFFSKRQFSWNNATTETHCCIFCYAILIDANDIS